MSGCVKVAVEGAAFKYDRLYSYSVPDVLRERAVPGASVLVPFGKGGRERVGVILAEDSQPPEDLKSIIDVELRPALNAELVELVFFLRERTLCTYYEAVRAILPRNSRSVARDEGVRSASESHLETVFIRPEAAAPPRLTEKQRAVYEALENGPLSYPELKERCGVSRDVIARLADKGIIERRVRPREIELLASLPAASGPEPSLTAAQQRALGQIEANIASSERPDVTLLRGVTSSGKTLIYAELLARYSGDGHSALLLVPEIALATQTLLRLRSRFGERLGILHSSLSDSERQLEWDGIKSGRFDVVVGTRSAVFAPMPQIGIIIVDEEQESSYRSEQSPRFDALSVAAYRAKKQGAHLLLASATPSIDTFYKAECGRINLVELGERYGDMPLPKVRVVDMRRELLAGNSLSVSKYLKDQVDRRLLAGEQCILLLNRRGYRTVSVCTRCKAIVKCSRCDTALVYHKESRTHVCHYCGHTEPLRETCSECGGVIRHTGIGTQKIEEELGELFPTARVARLDLDVAARKNTAARLLSDFSEGKYDILVGTQMIAKGLDFKKVTLVGVLTVDQLLLMPDYRAAERTFSMLTQVVGRSGRGDTAGEAVIQTIDPENPVIRLAAKQDYRSFYKDEIISRRAHLYPPFCAICTVGFVSAEEGKAAGSAARFFELLTAKASADTPLRVLGPAPMRIAYVNELYRYRLTVKCRGDRPFRRLLAEVAAEFSALPEAADTRVFIDFGSTGDFVQN